MHYWHFHFLTLSIIGWNWVGTLLFCKWENSKWNPSIPTFYLFCRWLVGVVISLEEDCCISSWFQTCLCKLNFNFFAIIHLSFGVTEVWVRAFQQKIKFSNWKLRSVIAIDELYFFFVLKSWKPYSPFDFEIL